MHDKKANTAERVAWSDTGNMHTQDIEKAALVMAYIDKNAESLKRDFGGSAVGRKSEVGNVYHYSLSWAHGENPDQQHQQEQALKTLERLGLSTHQYYMVAHDDTEHKHVHIVANLVNPENGKIHTPSFDKRELQAWALEYEREHIMHCHKREENAQKREQGQQVKYQEQKQDYSEKITRAYYAADSGKAFIHALNEEGLELAKARRGYNFVVVDDQGDIQKLSRQLNIEEKGKKKTEVIQNLLKDIDREKLKDADALAKEIKDDITEKLKLYDRDAQELEQQKALADAAEKYAETKAKQQEKEERLAAQVLRKQKQVELQAKQAAYDKEKQAFDERERQSQYQRQIDKKTAESRQRWDIEELTQKRNQAAQDLQNNSGFIARLTGKKQIFADKLEAQEKTLQERLGRFEDDINAFNANRSPEIQLRELKKHGFNVDLPTVQTDAIESQKQSEKLRPSNDNMNKKIDEDDAPSASWFNAKKKKIFDSRREWELVAFEKSVEEQAAKMHQASARPIEQKFNDIGELRSPEELKKVTETMQADNNNVSRKPFEEGLSAEHRKTLENYKLNNSKNAEQNQERQSQDKGYDQSFSIDND